MVVQHLDPTHKALLVPLLQRVTAMPVSEVVSQVLAEANHVYVLPPNAEVSVDQGRLCLSTPTEKRGLRLPIDALFNSMAQNLGAKAVAVLLSGMGADGTVGMQAIRAAGGVNLVQDPKEAQFGDMPLSAVSAGCVDFVSQASELPQHLETMLAGSPPPPPKVASPSTPPSAPPRAPIDAVFATLLSRTGHDFSSYKPSTLHRRIERRMHIHGTADLDAYAALLQNNEQEVELLFKELLIGVTSFFRDPLVWDHLRDKALPELLATQAPDASLRAWVVACSSGEEAYTLAMVFTEALERLPTHRGCKLQVFATDLSAEAVAVARIGRYKRSIEAAMPPERLSRFFVACDDGWQVSKDIRDMVLFAQHDVLRDPPFTRLDMLCCRNLLIYFDATLHKRLLPLFHYSLRSGGLMLLGSAETAASYPQLFAPQDVNLRLYAALPRAPRKDPTLLLQSFPPISDKGKVRPVSNNTEQPPAADSLQTAADRVLLDALAPPAVIVNAQGDIVYINGRTGKYLEPATGKVNWNFHAMVKESLRAPIAQALSQAEPLQQLRGLVLAQKGKQKDVVDVAVHALQDPAVLKGMSLIVFRDQPAMSGGRRKGGSVANESHLLELQQCRDEIQHMKEEMRASNEELQSTNEELQSTNEELTTSKEEMQSMNEELQTVNAQMQTKLDDLAIAQSDMKHLLNSADIAMLFLDQSLNVNRFTERATKLFKLREGDIGRPLSDLHSSLVYPELDDDTREALRSQNSCEKEMPTNDGRWFSMRIMPYRRQDQVIDGAVLTFVDITSSKLREARLQAPPAA